MVEYMKYKPFSFSLFSPTHTNLLPNMRLAVSNGYFYTKIKHRFDPHNYSVIVADYRQAWLLRLFYQVCLMF